MFICSVGKKKMKNEIYLMGNRLTLKFELSFISGSRAKNIIYKCSFCSVGGKKKKKNQIYNFLLDG